MSDEAKGSRFKIIGEIISELKKVVWLSRQEWIYLTFLVLLVALVSSVVLGGVDFGFTKLVNALFIPK